MPKPNKEKDMPRDEIDLPRDAAPALGYGGGDLASRDASGEVSERDLSPGQRRRSGQRVETGE